MKKIYSFVMAAAVSALACSAAQPLQLSNQQVTDFNFLQGTQFTKDGSAISVSNSVSENDIKKAPAYAAAKAPASLEGKYFMLYFSIVERTQTGNNTFPVNSSVTFTKTESDIQGVDCYMMTNFFESKYGFDPQYNVVCEPFKVYYDPAVGELEIPSPQIVIKNVPLTDGSVADGQTFNLEDHPNMYIREAVSFYFKFNGEGFEWIRESKIQDEDGTYDYTSAGMIVGTRIQENGQTVIAPFFWFEDFDLAIADGVMEFSFGMVDPDNKNEYIPTPISGGVFVTTTSDMVIIENFAPELLGVDVPFTIDTKAKTLTANNVMVLEADGLKWYLSEAADMWNAFEEEGAYKLPGTYKVENGKTVISFPEWNAFAFSAADGGDINRFVPLYPCKITLDMDLDAMFAGVDNVAVDANENAPVEYYNLQGVRVQNPENGLYIRRQGNKSTKVIL